MLDANPTDAGKIPDGGNRELDGVSGITTFEASDGTNTNTYAAVAANDDNGVQILKLTSGTALLSSPTVDGRIGDGGNRELDGASGITTFGASGITYAAVASWDDNGVQILKTAFANSPPVLAAAPTITVDGNVTTITDIFNGSAVSIRWTATDADGDPITYAWRHDRTDLLTQFSSTTDTVEFTVPEFSEDATLTVTLTTTDHHGAADSDTLSLELVILAADAGHDRIVARGAAVTLDGSSSTDTDGTTYAWAQTSGTPTVQITNGDSTAPSFTAPEVTSPVDLVFTLEVARAGFTPVTDTVTVRVDPRRLCHDVGDAGKRSSADPAGHRNRHDHRLGRQQPRRDGSLKPRGPRVRRGGHLHRDRLRRVAALPLGRPRGRSQARLDRAVGHRLLDLHGGGLPGGDRHDPQRGRRPRPVRGHRNGSHVPWRLLLQRRHLLLERLAGHRHEQHVPWRLLLQRRHLLLERPRGSPP